MGAGAMGVRARWRDGVRMSALGYVCDGVLVAMPRWGEGKWARENTARPVSECD